MRALLLIPALIAEGHQVTASTRSAGKSADLAAAGAAPVVMDGLDRDSVLAAVQEAAPEDPAKQIDLAYRIALSRSPREDEAALARDFLQKRSLSDFTHVLLNLNEFLYVR